MAPACLKQHSGNRPSGRIRADVAVAQRPRMRSFPVTDVVRSYAVAHGSWRPDPVVRNLQEETAALGDVAGMQVGDDQGQLLTMLTRLTGARRAVEVGTFTGYSSLCIAR